MVRFFFYRFTSIFSFSHKIFKGCVSRIIKTEAVCEGLRDFVWLQEIATKAVKVGKGPVRFNSRYFRKGNEIFVMYNLIHAVTKEICWALKLSLGFVITNSEFKPFRSKPWFIRVCSTSLQKTLREKEKLLVTRNFSFSHSVFYPFWELFTIFIRLKIVVCKLFHFGRV